MNTIIEALKQTPWWVYLVLYILVQRGIAARRPSVTALWRLAILPAIFAGLDIQGILKDQAVTNAMWLAWLLALLVGAGLGYALVRHARVRADHTQWLIGLDGNRTVLPLILVIFALKYAVAYGMAVQAPLAGKTALLLASLIVSGVCTGIFVGRFGTYVAKFWWAPSEPLTVDTATPTR